MYNNSTNRSLPANFFVDKLWTIVYTIDEGLSMFIFVIKNIRESKNISLKELSEETGVSKSYLFELENNKRLNVTLDKLYKISTVLDVNVKELFYTSLDIEDLRKELHNRITKYGLNSEQVMEISKLIDLLVNVHFKELD